MSSQASTARKESNEVEQGVLEMMSSSFPSSSSGRFSSANEDPSTRIQVIISPDPNQSHAHTPPFKDTSTDTSTAASLQDENMGVNEKTPPIDLGSLRRELYRYALKGDWEGAKSIYDKFPQMIPMQLTVNGDTALHIAARANNITFVQELVKMLDTPEDLEITNSNGNTAFCMAAISGNADLFQTMIEKNENLPQIRDHNKMLPVHLAALNGHSKTVQYLSTEDQLKNMAEEDIERLFFITISCRMYGVATKLLEKYPARLAIARDDQEQLAALHILARKPSQFDMEDGNNEEAPSGLSDKLLLLQKLSDHVRQYERALDLMTKPSKVIFDAVKEGNIQTVKCLLDTIPELLEHKESNGQNLLHIAALYRQLDIFEFILKTGTANLLIWEVDNDHNNVLHFAARLSKKVSSNLRPSILLPRELRWFQEVKKRVPAPELRTMRNNKGETPEETFSADHEELLKEAQKTAKEIAEPCIVAATLIATVVFPAALTAPGDDRTISGGFTNFFLPNAAAMFTASASVLIFLTIYTSSWFTDNDSFISLRRRLICGLVSLVISVITMAAALVAAPYFIFNHKDWVVYVTYGLALPAIAALSYLLYTTLNIKQVLREWIVG